MGNEIAYTVYLRKLSARSEKTEGLTKDQHPSTGFSLEQRGICVPPIGLSTKNSE
jgi:hypothetical protein